LLQAVVVERLDEISREKWSPKRFEQLFGKDEYVAV
jgi:hypothetical protein